MYRMELKGKDLEDFFSFGKVPNVPYGVESTMMGSNSTPCSSIVPNVPYGVESSLILRPQAKRPPAEFLMYRMELKVRITSGYRSPEKSS